ncbi:radical SAM family heme chaperone HemW [Bacillus sp. 2205SS5-2]|uniref:radical SAM family heme chaperone HemW n=1 Tax=Bacillus sp. 2205SS5-2 TaxID=3109031 RepID=UPI0030049C19
MVSAAYIHIPFCEHICHYCDFNKVFLKGQPVDEYLHFLDQEIKVTLEQFPTEDIQTIFVGGGTPTSLSSKQLDILCSSIRNHLPYQRGEFTFEANPGDLSKEKLEVLRSNGVNRLSFGVQSFNNDLLRKIGRTHTAEEVYTSIATAKETGFENISIDLIYSLPTQTISDFEETLDAALALDLPHYSSYSLIIEPKTIFYNLMQKGQLPLPGQDKEADMFELLMKKMDNYGLKQYEISNFAKPGFESKHNLVYWNNEEYYGFGAGSHGYMAGVRRANYGPLRKYMQPLQENKLPFIEEIPVSKKEKMEEEMFLGLRKMEGVSRENFLIKYEIDLYDVFSAAMIDLTKKELIEDNSGWVRLTNKGKFLGNEVFQSFLQ